MASITDVATVVVIALFDKTAYLRRWVGNLHDNLFLRLFWPHVPEFHPIRLVFDEMNFSEGGLLLRLKYPRVVNGRRLIAIYQTFVRGDDFGLNARVRIYMGKPKGKSKKEDYVVYWSYADSKTHDYLFSTVHSSKPFYFAQIGTFFDMFYNFTIASQAILRWYRKSQGASLVPMHAQKAGEVSDASTE